MKKIFLAVYNYGSGRIWVRIAAREPKEITDKYPELEVVLEKPAWMTEEQHRSYGSKIMCDIDDEPAGWFAVLLQERATRT